MGSGVLLPRRLTKSGRVNPETNFYKLQDLTPVIDSDLLSKAILDECPAKTRRPGRFSAVRLLIPSFSAPHPQQRQEGRAQ